MSENLKYNEDPNHATNLLRTRELELEAGMLGKFLGSPQRAASSIAWVMIFLLICSGILTLFFSCAINATEYWKIIAPLITLALGYLFGRKSE